VSNADADLEAWLKVDAPAKINLMLSVHGRRGDGFHALSSVVAAVDFGDILGARLNQESVDHLECDRGTVPVDGSNLVLKAAEAFRRATGYKRCFDFHLSKRVPVGAGLGGGSSDAVAALKVMDTLAATELGRQGMLELAAGLGSDCPFFVDAVPSLMRGRGEILEPLDKDSLERLRGQRLVLFRPDFGVETAWAYEQLAIWPERHYEAEASALARVDAFRHSGSYAELLHNVFESVVGWKYLAIPTLLEILRSAGCPSLMSGSGSCCFALLAAGEPARFVIETVRKSWGDGIFCVETSIC